MHGRLTTGPHSLGLPANAVAFRYASCPVSGSCPDRSLWRNSVSSDASAPSYAGTRPVRPQLETSSTVRLRSALSAGGMPPSNTL